MNDDTAIGHCWQCSICVCFSDLFPSEDIARDKGHEHADARHDGDHSAISTHEHYYAEAEGIDDPYR